VTPQKQDVRSAGAAESVRPAPASPPARIADFLYKTSVIAEMEVRRLRHDFTELVTRAIQPALWLLLFGEVFTRARLLPGGDLRYLDFMAPGILAQSVLFVAIFYGISLLWERDLGLTNKLLVSPTPRAALVLGKALSAGIRCLPQAVIVYGLSLLLGVKLNPNPLAVFGVLALVFLSAALFSTFSLIIACLVKTRERFMGIGQLLTMPLFFASNAIYPISMMPGWLRFISSINPLSYQVDALRALMLANGTAAFGLGTDFCVLVGLTVILVMAGARLYHRVLP
jgi:ABC-2 type transport system permease protein